MNAQISANEISRFSFVGIGVDRNEGTVTAAGNSISQCGYGILPMSSGIGVRGTSLPVVVERNEINCDDCGLSLWPKNGIGLASTNVVLRSNVVTGQVRDYGIWLTTFMTYVATDCDISKNRLIELVAGHAQVSIDVGCNSHQLTSNDYGTVNQVVDAAGIVVASNANQLEKEHFWGAYSGVLGTPPVPCIWLKATSADNSVSGMKYHDAPHGSDPCTQIRDNGTNNTVDAPKKC